MQPYPPAPAAQRRNTRTIVLLVVGVTLALCIVGGGIGAFFVYKGLRDPAKEPSNVTLAFLDAVKAGKPKDAYEHLCAQTKQRYSFEQFRLYVAGRPWPVDYEVKTVNVADTEDAGTADVVTSLRYVEGSVKDHTFHLVREGGRWKVCAQTDEPY